MRLDPLAAAPSLMKEWRRASLAIAGSLDLALAELIEILSSQINGYIRETLNRSGLPKAGKGNFCSAGDFGYAADPIARRSLL